MVAGQIASSGANTAPHFAMLPTVFPLHLQEKTTNCCHYH